MIDINQDLEKIEEIDEKNDSIWMQTRLSDFSYKCIMNKHDQCHDPKCKCICHHK